MKLSNIAFKILGGVNVATILVMLLCGYADHLDPRTFPVLANAGLAYPVLLAIDLLLLVVWIFVKPRGMLIAVAGLVLCYFPTRTYCPLNMPHDAPEVSLKVLSYNVMNFNTEEDCTPENAIAKYIIDQDADIACLEESACGQFFPIADSIFATAYAYRDTVRRQSGDQVTLLSKYPIISRERINYESNNNMSVAFKVRTKKSDIIVVINHLETTGLNLKDKASFRELVGGELENDSARSTSRRLLGKLAAAAKKRAPQADAVARYVANHAGTPMIVCGDFNDSPLSYARRTIAKGLTDCFIAAGNGPGISYHYARFYVRIDNILVSDDFQPYACKVDRTVKLSDHYPIVCALKLKSDSK